LAFACYFAECTWFETIVTFPKLCQEKKTELAVSFPLAGIVVKNEIGLNSGPQGLIPHFVVAKCKILIDCGNCNSKNQLICNPEI